VGSSPVGGGKGNQLTDLVGSGLGTSGLGGTGNLK
jgi:hypothetical protein